MIQQRIENAGNVIIADCACPSVRRGFKKQFIFKHQFVNPCPSLPDFVIQAGGQAGEIVNPKSLPDCVIQAGEIEIIAAK